MIDPVRDSHKSLGILMEIRTKIVMNMQLTNSRNALQHFLSLTG